MCCGSDYASVLNRGATQCRFMSNRISPSTEAHAFLIRIQSIISVAFGQPHLYKNFWFGGEVYQRRPTMLFGYIPSSKVNVTTRERPIRLFKALLKSDPLLSLDSSDNVIDFRSERICKVMYQKWLITGEEPKFTLVGPWARDMLGPWGGWRWRRSCEIAYNRREVPGLGIGSSWVNIVRSTLVANFF